MKLLTAPVFDPSVQINNSAFGTKVFLGVSNANALQVGLTSGTNQGTLQVKTINMNEGNTPGLLAAISVTDNNGANWFSLGTDASNNFLIAGRVVSGTDTAALDVYLRSGLSTGAAAANNFHLQSSAPLASGSTDQTA